MKIHAPFKRLTSATLLWALLHSNSFAFGAIVVGDADPKALDNSTEQHFIVIGQSSRDVARRIGIAQCEAKGLYFCHDAAVFDACGAYAKSDKSSGTGYGVTKKEATDIALASCGKDCKVVDQVCNGGDSI